MTYLNRIARTVAARFDRKACIIAVGEFGGSRTLFKNRDRNYTPEIKVHHEVRDGVEVLYLRDSVTGWVEGLNDKGIGIVNAALSVKADEKVGVSDANDNKDVKLTLKDGERVLKALSTGDLHEALTIIQTHKGGLAGHTFVSSPDETYAVEGTRRGHEFKVKKLRGDTTHVRTNHGIWHEDSGYTEEDHPEDYESSTVRRDTAIKVLRDVNAPDQIAPAIYGLRRDDLSDPRNMVRDTDNMKTTSQVVLDLTALTFSLYLIPDKVKYKGYVNDLPKGYKPKLKFKVYEYTDIDGDGDFDVLKIKKDVSRKASMLPLQEPEFNLREVTKHLLLLEDHLFHADRRCPDCIWKHLLTAEAFVDEACTLGSANPIPPGTASALRSIDRDLRSGTEWSDVAQRVRALRKSLVPSVMRSKLASR